MLQYLKNETNVAYTTNGAKMYATTKSSLLDLFGQIGAMRTRTENDIIKAFDKALVEDELLSTKMLFHTRDCRGGLGERNTFRICLRHLANVKPEIVRKNLQYIPFFGRWDDILELFDTSLKYDALELIQDQLVSDMNGEHPSLCAKWMPSVNTSSRKSRETARMMAKYYDISEKDYRKILATLRKRIRIIEREMSARNWSGIDYESVPSQAGILYRKAFLKNDNLRYAEYLESLKKGEKKVNASVLFPYEIVRKVQEAFYHSADDILFDAMWKALPDYIGDTEENAICVVDTSGSMSGLPIQVAISLGLYCAERLKGAFHNHFITFSAQPTLQEVKGTTLIQKVRNMNSAHWDMNTNLEAVFNLILRTAVKNQLPQSDLPTRLFIISDMQFDEAMGNRNNVNDYFFATMKEKFTKAGYEMPNVVFWNVNAVNEAMPITVDERGVQLVSGCSPSTFKSVLANKYVSAYDLMLEVLNQERYNVITI